MNISEGCDGGRDFVLSRTFSGFVSLNEKYPENLARGSS